jgi:hypothetical protein
MYSPNVTISFILDRTLAQVHSSDGWFAVVFFYRYMLPWESVLDFKTMSQIIDSGHSRIPVYRDERLNIEGVLYVKELMFVDPDDNLPLETIVNFYDHEIVPVWYVASGFCLGSACSAFWSSPKPSLNPIMMGWPTTRQRIHNQVLILLRTIVAPRYDTTLDDLLVEFKAGRTHLVLVEKIVESDSFNDNAKEVGGATFALVWRSVSFSFSANFVALHGLLPHTLNPRR